MTNEYAQGGKAIMLHVMAINKLLCETPHACNHVSPCRVLLR